MKLMDTNGENSEWRSLVALFLLFSSLSVSAAPKPNIVLMMVDDMGIGDTSAYLGVKLAEKSPPIGLTQVTPNLEEFARKALVFTDVHAGASMCSSSRYSLLAGRFGHRPYLKRQGWLPHGSNRPMIQRALVTLPEMLKANGYDTACIGKWHVGMDFDNGKGEPATDFYHQDVDFTKPLLDATRPTMGLTSFLGFRGIQKTPWTRNPGSISATTGGRWPTVARWFRPGSNGTRTRSSPTRLGT